MIAHCVKGNIKLGLVKNRVYPVLSVEKLGKDDGYRVKLVLQLTDRRVTLYVPTVHNRKLAESTGFNVYNGGDPTQKARLVGVGLDIKGGN